MLPNRFGSNLRDQVACSRLEPHLREIRLAAKDFREFKLMIFIMFRAAKLAMITKSCLSHAYLLLFNIARSELQKPLRIVLKNLQFVTNRLNRCRTDSAF